MKWFLSLLVAFLFFACHSSSEDERLSNGNSKENEALKSRLFQIEERDGLLAVTAVNPLDPNSEEKYILQSKPAERGNSIGFRIKYPAEKVVCLSTSHIGFINAIDAGNRIAGSRNADLIYSEKLREKYSSGKLQSVGGAELNLEKLVALDADVVFASVYDAGGMEEVEKMRKLGIPVVLVSEFLEEQPLRRAEWIKFFAAFFGEDQQQKADAVYSKIELDYQKTAGRLEKVQESPSVITGLPWGGNWFVPGGKSFQANFLKDAGAKYIFEENNKTNSFVVDFEIMLQRGMDVPYWINVSDAESKDEIAAMDNRFPYFAAYKNDGIFNNNARKSDSGGNDYWESGAVRPDLILKDLGKIFHPELFEKHSFFYYQHLQ